MQPSLSLMRYLINTIHASSGMADLMTIIEKEDSVNGHVSWVGDGNNVLHDLMLACASLGYRHQVCDACWV